MTRCDRFLKDDKMKKRKFLTSKNENQIKKFFFFKKYESAARHKINISITIINSKKRKEQGKKEISQAKISLYIIF